MGSLNAKRTTFGNGSGLDAALNGSSPFLPTLIRFNNAATMLIWRFYGMIHIVDDLVRVMVGQMLAWSFLFLTGLRFELSLHCL